MVCLSGSVLVQLCVVNNPTGAAIRFGSHNHAATPRHRVIHWYSLYDPKLLVPVQACLDGSFPMKWDSTGGVDGPRFNIFIGIDFHGGRFVH